MDALIKFVCTGRKGESSQFPVTVSFSPVPATVSDLKAAIQDQFQIPICLQSITVASDPVILADSQLLKSLYLHPDEYFTVTYLDKANIKSCTKYRMHFPDYIEEIKDPDRPLQNIYNTKFEYYVSSFLIDEYRLKRLTPWWGLSTVEANRQYLIQDGIIDDLLKIYSILLNWTSKKKHLSQYNLSEFICFITDHDYRLMAYCMMFFWHFAETREARLYVIRRGGFEMLVGAMEVFSTRTLLDGYYPKRSGYGEDVIQYIRFCVGCLCTYGEFSHCQLLLARSSPALYNLVTFGVTSDSDEMELKQMTAYCLFRVSLNVNTHKYLLEVELLEKILLFFTHSKTMFSVYAGVLTCYSLSAMFSRLLSFSLDLVPTQFQREVLSAVDTFLDLVPMETVRKGLELHGARENHYCRWVTLSHLIDVFFSPIFSTVEGRTIRSSVSFSRMDDICMEMNLKCLTVELSRLCHRQLAVKQGLLECLVCLPWVVEEKWRGEVCAVVKLFEDMSLPVPTLHSLAAVTLAKAGQFSIRDIFKF